MALNYLSYKENNNTDIRCYLYRRENQSNSSKRYNNSTERKDQTDS